MQWSRWCGAALFASSVLACQGTTSTTGGTGGAGTSTTTGLFAGASGVGGGCGLGGESNMGTGCVGVSGGVKYSTDVAPIFDGCTGEACHGSLTYASTVNQKSTQCCDRAIVAPGDANHSYLLDKIHGQHLCGGLRMPRDLPPVPGSTEDTLRRWICEGAPND